MLTSTVDQEALQQLPVHGVPEHLPTLDDPHTDLEPLFQLDINNSTDQEETSQHNATGPQTVSHSFIPQQQEQQQEQDAIRAFINGEHPLNWPSNEGDPINEFQTEGLATMAFPTLFPYGKGDPTKKSRLRDVKLTEGFKHLIRYADRSPTGKFTWRFASHPRFPYWALNMKQTVLRIIFHYLRKNWRRPTYTMNNSKMMKMMNHNSKKKCCGINLGKISFLRVI